MTQVSSSAKGGRKWKLSDETILQLVSQVRRCWAVWRLACSSECQCRLILLSTSVCHSQDLYLNRTVIYGTRQLDSFPWATRGGDDRIAFKIRAGHEHCWPLQDMSRTVSRAARSPDHRTGGTGTVSVSLGRALPVSRRSVANQLAAGSATVSHASLISSAAAIERRCARWSKAGRVNAIGYTARPDTNVTPQPHNSAVFVSK